jgi:hypothetical protein
MGRSRKPAKVEESTLEFSGDIDESSEAIEEVEAVEADTDSSELNDDGVVKGKQLSEEEYWALVNKLKLKK